MVGVSDEHLGSEGHGDEHWKGIVEVGDKHSGLKRHSWGGKQVLGLRGIQR